MQGKNARGVRKNAAGQLRRYYWGAHQRFFRCLCMALKMAAVIRLAKESLRANKSVVIGLQCTGEAATDQATTLDLAGD